MFPYKKASRGSVVTNSSESNNGHRIARISTSRAIGIGRLVFLMFLVGMAASFGTVAHHALTGTEVSLAETHYESICDRILEEAVAIAERKRLGTLSMASVVAQMHPDVAAWPFVTIPGYEGIATNIIATSSGQAMGVAPLVRPDQLEDFETFIYDYYETKRNPPFPNGTVISSFGKGIWGIDPTINTSDHRYRITDGSTTYGSKYDVITPIITHNDGYNLVLLFNSHSEKIRGLAIDSIIDCSNMRAASDNPDSHICGKVTGILELVGNQVSLDPGAVLMQPIYPANNSTVLTGILMSSITWDELFQIGSSVSGIDCVLSAEDVTYTYRITNGVAKLSGKGDLHDPKFDGFKKSIALTGSEYYNNASAIYYLSLYPTNRLLQTYSTANPSIAAVGSVCIILFTSILFMLYDFMVRKEFNTKDNLLESKRKFVRFISHEVRTPLNSVAMGISLLQDECANALGHKSAHEMLKREGSQGNLMKLADAATKQDDVWKDTVSEWFYLLQDIQNNAQSSVDVLNDLLNYDKVETGSLSLELSVIPIWKLIEKTANEFALPLTKKKIEFDLLFTDIAASDWERNKAISSCPQRAFLSKECRKRKVVGDVVRLTQVLRNLIANAVKFTKEGGQIKIKVSWIPTKFSSGQKEKKFLLKCGTEVSAVESGHLQVKVSDSGAGMTKKQLSLLFRHGVQFNVSELQAGQGSGLGLFIAKGILEEHKGHLYADSEGLGMGSTFTLELPMYTIQGFSEDVSQNDETENCSSSSESAGFRILVVDDSAPNRKLLARILTNKGHQVDVAEDGSMAVAKVSDALSENNPYNTILLDYEMPVMNGPNAAKAIRAMGCDVFIVGVTGNMLAEDVAHFRSCGANTLLGKPFKIKCLEEAWLEHGITNHKTTEDRV